MATSEENDLIGYDPLAWMDADADKNEQGVDDESCDSDAAQIEVTCAADIDLSDDYADDSLGNAEESAFIEDALAVEEIDEESDSVSMEAVEEPLAVAPEAVASDTDSSQLDLDATLTIQNVVKLHEKLKDLVAVHDQIEINASDVSSIDTATLQLLVSLKKDAVKLDKQVTIIYPSPRFVESARLLGLLDVLDVQDA